MYNRYIPQEEDYIPVAEPAPPPPKAEKTGGQSAPGASLLSALGLGNLFSGAEGLVSRLLPDSVDAGDILLLLIVLYLLAEGDDLCLAVNNLPHKHPVLKLICSRLRYHNTILIQQLHLICVNLRVG